MSGVESVIPTGPASVGPAALLGIVARRFELSDADRRRLRILVGRVEGDLSRVGGGAAGADAGGAAGPLDALRRSWADLAALLAMPPEPAGRECPRCRHVAMRAALLCGHCWSRLEPERA